MVQQIFTRVLTDGAENTLKHWGRHMHSSNFQPSGVWMQAALILAKVKSGPEEMGLIIVKSNKNSNHPGIDVSQELLIRDRAPDPGNFFFQGSLHLLDTTGCHRFRCRSIDFIRQRGQYLCPFSNRRLKSSDSLSAGPFVMLI